MATDKTWFDDYLKHNLARDLAFRAVVWAVISGMTLHAISLQPSFSSFEYLGRALSSLMQVITPVLVTASVLALFAMILKDLEHVAPATWGQGTVKGRIGGFVRRLAGDLTLWLLGALITLLIVILFGAAEASRLGADDKAVAGLLAMAVLPVMGAIVVGVFNVWIRRARPPIAQEKGLEKILTTPARVVVFYVSLMVAIVVLGR